MKKSILLYILLFVVVSSNGQFSYYFNSAPDSAEVKLNGEVKGFTPCKVKYFWRQKVDDKLVFEVSNPGYKTWTESITEKPYQFRKTSNVDLEVEIPKFDLGEHSAVVDFDLLIADFREGKVIGHYKKRTGEVETLKWEGATKVGSSDFNERCLELLMNAGFTTPGSTNSQLFDGKGDASQLPRFVIGANLKDYNVAIKNNSSTNILGTIASTTYMEIEWQVFDKVADKVVYSTTTQSRYKALQNQYTAKGKNLESFTDAFISFLNDGKLSELVKNAEASKNKTLSAKKVGGQIEIAKVKLPEFTERKALVDFAKPSCVTIITDGGHGSGVIINEEGYVLSAYHVVEGVNTIKVKLDNGMKLDASVVSFSKKADVVLLDIIGSGYKPLPLETEGNVMLGEDVVTIGTPVDIGLGQSIASGLLSGNRKIEDRVFLQTDMALSPGNSGGPLLNVKGEIIGIIQQKVIAESAEGIGFAIPISKVIEELNLVVK